MVFPHGLPPCRHGGGVGRLHRHRTPGEALAHASGRAPASAALQRARAGDPGAPPRARPRRCRVADLAGAEGTDITEARMSLASLRAGGRQSAPGRFVRNDPRPASAPDRCSFGRDRCWSRTCSNPRPSSPPVPRRSAVTRRRWMSGVVPSAVTGIGRRRSETSRSGASYRNRDASPQRYLSRRRRAPASGRWCPSGEDRCRGAEPTRSAQKRGRSR